MLLYASPLLQDPEPCISILIKGGVVIYLIILKLLALIRMVMYCYWVIIIYMLHAKLNIVSLKVCCVTRWVAFWLIN